MEDEKHNNPATALSEINCLDLFQSNSNALGKLKTFLNKKSGDSSSVKSSTFDKNNNGNNDLISRNMKNITISDQVIVSSSTDAKREFSDLIRYCSIEKLKNDEHEKENINENV